MVAVVGVACPGPEFSKVRSYDIGGVSCGRTDWVVLLMPTYFIGYLDIIIMVHFFNSSCDIKINIKIVQNCCRKLTVKGLRVLAHRPRRRPRIN